MKSFLSLEHTQNKCSIFEQLLIYYFKFNLSSTLLQNLIALGFEYNTQIPFSLNIENLHSYFVTSFLIRKKRYFLPENSQKESSILKKYSYNIVQKSKLAFNTFFKLIETYKNINYISTPLYLMSNVEAKSNWNQIKQLLGMRGYASNAEGYLNKIPIMNSFSKGLSLYEYFLSCYGARKGVIDTAIKTADAGYLTRRLVENCQDLIIKEYSCGTRNFTKQNYNINTKGFVKLPLIYFLLGKILSKNCIEPFSGIVYFTEGTVLSFEKIKLLSILKSNLVFYVYNSMGCLSGRSVCNTCFGFKEFENFSLLGTSAGVIAGQSIGEPGTQLVLRTFHTGGVFNAKKISSKLFQTYSIFSYYNKYYKTYFEYLFTCILKPSYVQNSNVNICISKSEGYVKLDIYNNKNVKQIKSNLFKYSYNFVSGFKLDFKGHLKVTDKGYLFKKTLLFYTQTLNIKKRLGGIFLEINESLLKKLYSIEIIYKNGIHIILKNKINKWEHISISTELAYLYTYNSYVLPNSFGLKFSFSSNKRIFNIKLYYKETSILSGNQVYSRHNHTNTLIFTLKSYVNLYKSFYSIKNKFFAVTYFGRLALIN